MKRVLILLSVLLSVLAGASPIALTASAGLSIEHRAILRSELALLPQQQGIRNPAKNAEFISQAKNCLYNAKGLDGFQASLWMAGYKGNGTTGAGGLDIDCVSDSYGAGSGLSTDVQGFGIADNGCLLAWPNQLRNLVQPAINPPGIAGGYGWFQADRGGSGAATRAPTGSTAAAAGMRCNVGFDPFPGAGGGFGRQLMLFNFTAGQRYVLYDFNKTYFPITSIQSSGAASGIHKVDIYAKPAGTTPVTIGTGTYYTGTLTLDGGTNFWGSVSNLGTVTQPSTDWRLQVYNTNSSSEAYTSGFFINNSDTTVGIRVHSMGSPSSSVQAWCNEANTLSGMANLGRSALDGSTVYPNQNARLVIIMLGANDWGGRTKAQFKADMITLLTSIHGWTSAPSILLVQQTPRYDGGADDWLGVPKFRDALKEICDDATYGVYTSYIDMWRWYHYKSPQRILSEDAGIQSDHVHPSLAQHRDIARVIAACIIPNTKNLNLGLSSGVIRNNYAYCQ